MSNVPSNMKFAASHEWVLDNGDGTVTVGITDHAQELLGDVVFVELPEVGADLAAGDDSGVVESVKAASDIYAPLSGEIIAVNELLDDAPETVNSDVYGDGWFFKMKLSNDSELAELLDANAYAELCESEA